MDPSRVLSTFYVEAAYSLKIQHGVLGIYSISSHYTKLLANSVLEVRRANATYGFRSVAREKNVANGVQEIMPTASATV